MVCLANDVEELGPRVRSAVAVFPDADKIVVVVASGVGVTDPRLAESTALLSDECHIDIIVESPEFTLQTVSPEHALIMAWKLLPTGEKVVAFCVRECEVGRDCAVVNIAGGGILLYFVHTYFKYKYREVSTLSYFHPVQLRVTSMKKYGVTFI